jgi:tRNA-splicing ligase RtcB (3'-phosphate/5'-hydroxy nucleic acid ligase)
MLTGLKVADVLPVQKQLAESLFQQVPAGLGSRGTITLDAAQMDAMLTGGARWAVERGWGEARDLARVEETRNDGGRAARVRLRPCQVPPAPRDGDAGLRQPLSRSPGDCRTLRRADVADAFGLALDDVVVTIHCGSRGLGHQIGTEFLKEMLGAAKEAGIALPDRELACAPIRSEVGQRYLGAMRAGVNCALANREIIGHFTRQVFGHFFPDRRLDLLFDVSHNTCKVETHRVEGERRELFVHRKGATRAFGSGHESLPEPLRDVGQPVLIGGSMGTGSYILVGEATSEEKAFSSACHGAGRALSRHAALKQWSGRQVVDDLARQGIIIRSPSQRGVAEEAPGAYKEVGAVVRAAESAGLARRVARLRPVICIKG